MALRFKALFLLLFAQFLWGASISNVFVPTELCSDTTYRAIGTCPSGSEAFSYPGIPYPTALQPAAIMPTASTAANTRAGWPYDPVLTDTPTWTDASNQYYTDADDGSCSDSNNGGRGSPASPRCTIPGLSTNGNGTWTVSAGDQLFIAGAGATYGGDNDVQSVNMPGTEANPVWIIGVGADRPELRFERFFVGTGGMTHTFWDNVHFRSPTDDFRMQFTGGDAEYITFRNLECSGSEGTQSGNSRRCFSLGGTEDSVTQFIMFYDVEIYGLGRWQDDYNTSVDMHGIQSNMWSRYVWIIDSDIYNVQGDSFQCGNSNWWDFEYDSRPHYFYLGGNKLHDNYENAYDEKGCYHVIVSSNEIYNITNSVKAANGTAIITEQDSEGHIGGDNIWFINNDVHDAAVAFSLQATTDDAYPTLIGNVVTDITATMLNFTQRCHDRDGAGSEPNTCPAGADIVLNTFDCDGTATGLANPQNPSGSTQEVNIIGNIFHDCTNGVESADINFEAFSITPLDITYMYNSNYRTGSTTSLGNQTTRIDTYDSGENLLNTDHDLVDPDSEDFSLDSGSPAIDYVDVAPDAIANFIARYPSSMSTSFATNIAGNPRLVGSKYDIGAYERQ